MQKNSDFTRAKVKKKKTEWNNMYDFYICSLCVSHISIDITRKISFTLGINNKAESIWPQKILTRLFSKVSQSFFSSSTHFSQQGEKNFLWVLHPLESIDIGFFQYLWMRKRKMNGSFFKENRLCLQLRYIFKEYFCF